MADKPITAFPNLSAEMARLGVEVEDISGVVSRGTKTVKSWLNGKTEPSYAQAKAIRDQLFPDVNLEYLFSDTPLGTPEVN